MSDNKKYYWLKLKDDFFEDDTIQYIEEQENGIQYAYFYLKLCLKALKTEGRLIRIVGETLIPYDVKSISKLTGVEYDTVRSAMQLFQQIGLVKILESGEIYLAQINEMIGSETDKAVIMRRKRALEKQEKQLIGNNVTTKSNNVTKVLPKCYTEIEIEKEIDKDKELEKEIDIDKENKDDIPFDEIIGYLNQCAGTHYKSNIKQTKSYIQARWSEGFNLLDFQTVIKKKCDEWIGTEYEKYLRPQTLFCSKFENYLNQRVNTKEEDWLDKVIRGEYECTGNSSGYKSITNCISKSNEAN